MHVEFAAAVYLQNIGGDNTAATDVDGGLRLYSGPQSGIGLPWEAKDPGQLCLIATDDPVSLLKDPAMHACNSKAVNQALSYATREGTRFALIIKRHANLSMPASPDEQCHH